MKFLTHVNIVYLITIFLCWRCTSLPDQASAQIPAKPAISAESTDSLSLQKWEVQPSSSGAIEIKANGRLLTALNYQSFRKPILYPVNGPGGVMVMRHWPVQTDIAGEAHDHPHHKSLWFAHGDVNGHSFWDEKCRIKTIGQPTMLSHPPTVIFENQWIVDRGPENESETNRQADQDQPIENAAAVSQVIASDTTTIICGAMNDDPDPLSGGWWIDYRVSLQATHGEIKLGDTKEGTFAIRTHPNLRLKNDPGRGVLQVNGHAINSAGQTDLDLWGQPAKWVAYHGTIEQQAVTLAIFDHPSNLRHPTTWHAREYGLVAANPFGLSPFLKQAPGSGDFIIPAGANLAFRYRLLIMPGVADRAQIEERFQDFAHSH